MQSFSVFVIVAVSMNKLLNKQSSYWWFWDAMMLKWYHCNVYVEHGDCSVVITDNNINDVTTGYVKIWHNEP